MSDPFGAILIVLAPFVVFFVALALGVFGRRRACPDCGALLPVLCSPLEKTRRMWLEGGCVCPNCGCETDVAGRKVTTSTPPASWPIALWVALAGLLLAGAGIGAGALLLHSVAVPPAVAAPLVAPRPPQVVPVQPLN